MFVIGTQNLKEILARALNNECPHIYLGANHSFTPNTGWNYNTVKKCINAGYTVSLNYPINYHNNVKKELKELYIHINFIPQISFQFEGIENENPNLNLKIDDVDFEATNDGVWCFDLKDVCNDNNKTSWSQYKDDKII